ncbi:TonB-dependent receptor [Haloferula chungangensis]|uniref:TonB-dependent receptor n=1 Tax=Haloferula chungangensis TaxID=1048331 RepID=A0ABW2L796_9BACT
MKSIGTLLALSSLTFGQSGSLPETIVLAERREPGEQNLSTWDSEEITGFSPRSIDELLALDPSFSLYRRQPASLSNPTSAGISLRNTGATAASRTLVLRDGIPQNDPFGGWINWTRYEPSALESASLVPAAQSAVWGNLSPAGSIRLTSREITENRHLLRLTGGSQGTLGASTSHEMISDDGALGVGLNLFAFHSDGYYAIPDWQRGPIDRKLDLDHAGADLRFVWQAAENLTVEPSFSFYDERRGNGTPVTGNTTEALDFSLRLTAEHRDASTQLLTYYQRRRFASVFSSVDASRSSETVALNQFHVPGEGLGGALVHRREISEAFSFSGGADFRLLSGETNEDAGVFRRRRAGGDQNFAGLFTTLGWEITPVTRLDSSLRLDRWSLTDGSRIEKSLTSGALLRQDIFPDRDGWEPSTSLALEHQLRDDLSARLSAGTSFRAPNINELYRPYRVRNDITEANAALDPERFYSLEAGLEWKPDDCLTLGLDFFQHWIHDAIANVPITDPAQIAAIFGTLPPGGTGSQRQNVDEARVLGLQGSAEWQPDNFWTFRFDGLWSETEFTSSPTQPLLTGQPFPQAPDLRLIGSARLQATDNVSFFTGLEYASHLYDDALSSRPVPSYWTCRIGGSWQATESIAFHARIENLFDTEIPTGLSSDGIQSIGQPRAFWLTTEWQF